MLPVLVVGGGPVGLTAALALRARSLPVILLEAEPEVRGRPGSRAIFVHRASLQLLEVACPGLGLRIARDGLVWQTKRTFWRGHEVFSHTYPPFDHSRLPPFTSLPQTQMERLLLAACNEAGVRIEWNAKVESVEVRGGGIEVRTSSGARLAADYLVAADGAHSAVRQAIGVTMAGSRSSNAVVVVDVAECPDEPMTIERSFHYQHPAADGRNVLIVPFAGGWRVDLICRGGDDPDQLSSAGSVREWISRLIGARYARRLTWVSKYHFVQLLARRFADETNRVLLIGEAAHLFPPFGARGMNSGIVDAAAAADAVGRALCARGWQEAAAAVDGFAVERRRAAEENRDATDQAIAFAQSRGPLVRAKLAAAALLARRGRRAAGEWLDSVPYGPRRPSR